MACQSIDAALSLAFEYPSPRMPLIMAGFKTQYDVVVVGGGHNGLVSACYLAKAGLSVLVLEGNADPIETDLSRNGCPAFCLLVPG